MNTVANVPSALVINAPREYGQAFVFQALSATRRDVAWLTLTRVESMSSLGNRLVDQVNNAIGESLLGRGLPFPYVFSNLAALEDREVDVLLLVDEAQRNVDFARLALALANSSLGRIRTVVSGYSDHVFDTAWTTLCSESSSVLCDSNLLLVEANELVQLAQESGADTDQLLRAIGSVEGGVPYLQVLRAMQDYGSVKVPSLPADDTSAIVRASSSVFPRNLWRGSNSSTLVADFMRDVKASNARALRMLDDVGEHMMSRGEAASLAELTEQLRSQFPESADVMYWWFQAAIAMGHHKSARTEVLRFRRTHPVGSERLIAAFASVFRPANALELAKEARGADPRAETFAAEGYLRTLSGEMDLGIRLLRTAYDEYRAHPFLHRATLVANSISSAYIQMGQYRRGLYWAQQSLYDIQNHGISEQLISYSTKNILAYAHLLVGHVEEGWSFVEQIPISLEHPIPPTMEGLVTTLGDYALARGETNKAGRYYSKVYQELSSTMPGYAVLPYVRWLLRAQRTDDAAAVVAVAKDQLGGSKTYEHSLVRVAEAKVKSASGELSESDVTALFDDAILVSDAPLLTEALVACVCYFLAANMPERALELAEASRDKLHHLSESAVSLFSLDADSGPKAYAILSGRRSAEVSLYVLGDCRLERTGSGSESIPRQAATVLTLLAMNPEGLSGADLNLALYGGTASSSTIKSTVHRARRFAKIAAVPYRLLDDLTIDAMLLEEYIQVGRTAEAVELYKGELLPGVDGPEIEALRDRFEEGLRQAVLHRQEVDVVLRLAKRLNDDLEVWEHAWSLLGADDPRGALVSAHIRRLRAEYGLSPPLPNDASRHPPSP